MTVTHEIHGLVLTDHEFSVPLDHERPDGERIDVFAREVAAEDAGDRPLLVFFQGGPGGESPRPTDPKTPRWLPRALEDYRVLLLDQRGTGRSTPVGSLPGLGPEQQAAYLRLHRADSIVRDAELIRRELGIERWSVLGQELRRLLRLHVSVDRAGGAARGFRHRWPSAGGTADRRRLSGDVPASAGAQPAFLRAVSG